MSTQYYITDTPLPESQNFKALKELGLDRIQQASGNRWTNFNAGDPGVTILDQLCYALTELGYCIDFPIKDILTKKDDRLTFKHQFFHPEELLTTAPVTIEDYKRYLVDGISAIDNAVIRPIESDRFPISGVYETYLMLDPASKLDKEAIREAAFLQLNRLRCNGELFFKPKVLTPVNYGLKGSISLSDLKDLKSLFTAIDLAIRQTIFPKLSAKGYDEWIEEGKTINDIYNGPRLKNGWIPDSEFVHKKNKLSLAEVSAAIQSVNRVNAVALENFEFPSIVIKPIILDTKTATSGPTEIISFDPLADLKNGSLQIVLNGKLLKSEADLKHIKQLLNTSGTNGLNKRTAKQSTLHTKPSVPKGKYRDIESYYSIQNTFPEIYGVGEHAIDKNASEYKMALSKQLKAYLTFFDQVMANEFSQLANLDHLLSFKNAVTTDPLDKKRFFRKKDQFQREHLQYPIPYLSFSPTYFCQSLYDTPGIRPLLKHYTAFDFEEVTTPTDVRIEDSWLNYQDDPYNGYIHGLMEGMEHQQLALERRNDFLNHLLARHGQSPELIDAIIEGAVYSGDPEQDKVIVKSLYLQNFALLNYYEQSAYDFLGADKIPNACPIVSTNAINELHNEVSTDFLFNTKQIDHKEALSSDLFRNYSGIQLKFFLLMGIRSLYRYFILEQSKKEVGYKKLVSQAIWFMHHRGALFIETNLLAACARYTFFIRQAVKSGDKTTTYHYWEVQHLSIDEFGMLEKELINTTEITGAIQSEKVNINGKDYPVTSVTTVDNSSFQSIGDTSYDFSYTANWDTLSVEMGCSFFQSSIWVIAPNFIDTFSDHSFQYRFDLLMENSLPPHVGHQLFLLPPDLLTELLPAYINWRNSIRYVEGESKIGQLFQDLEIYGNCENLLELLQSDQSIHQQFVQQ